MRTIFRLCLVVAAVASISVAAVPVAEAKKNSSAPVKIASVDVNANVAIDKKTKQKLRKLRRKLRRLVNNLKDWLQAYGNKHEGQDEKFAALKAQFDAAAPIIAKALTDLEAGLLALKAALEGPVQDAFDDIEDALTDSTTGLVGLNLARPWFGVFAGDGTFLGGTGPVNGTDPPHGPGPGDAVRVGTGTYVVDFNADVSTRVYTVTVAPTGGAGLTVSAVNCVPGSASASIEAACDAAAGNTDPHPERVFVLLQNSVTGAPADGTFTITSLSC